MSNPNNLTLAQLEKQAETIREDIIRMLQAAGSGHSAGSLGMADIFTALYFHVLNHNPKKPDSVSYTHLRAHETVLDLVCRLLLEKKKRNAATTKVRYGKTSASAVTDYRTTAESGIMSNPIIAA